VRLRLDLAYDGTDFHGWAAQPTLRTVQGTLETALTQVLRLDRAPVTCAGRTDTGVHARGQVASLDVEGGPPPDRAAAALNTVLPDDVAVVAAEEAAPDFHARHSALARTYRYRILLRRTRSPFEQRRSLWWPRPVDEEGLAASAALLAGEHDFRAFTPTETQHEVFVRVVESAAWRRDGDLLELEITADSYLRHMVRTLVGTMLEREPAELAELLKGAPRSAAGSTAPAHGLYLTHVGYDKPPG